MSQLLEGKRAVVTGAAAGIGRAIAECFVAEGAVVVAVDIDADAVGRTVEEIGAEDALIGLAADVSSESEVADALSRSREKLGGIDVLCNNAGIQGAITPLVDTDVNDFDRVLAVNIRGVFLGMKHALPEMTARGSGSVINTASIAGHRGWPDSIGYFAAKHAVLGMTRAAAAEVGPRGVRVNAVCPGFIDTDLMRRFADTVLPDDHAAFEGAVTAQIPAGRYGTPAEVAQIYAYLASDRAAFVYGSDWVVDGGTLATRGSFADEP